MNKLFVNIIDSYWGLSDELGIYEQSKKLRHSSVYATELDIDQFEEKLKYTIMMDKNDGLELEINSTSTEHFIDIILLLGDEKDEEYNIDYLIDFLAKFKINDQTDLLEEENWNYDSFLYIRYAPSDIEGIINELRSLGLEVKVITETHKTFERGAGDYWIGYLLGLVTNATWDTIKFVGDSVKSKFDTHFRTIELANIDMETVKEKISKQMGISAASLRVVSFDSVEDGKYKILLKSRYDKVNVISDKKGNIIHYSIEEFTTTRI